MVFGKLKIYVINGLDFLFDDSVNVLFYGLEIKICKARLENWSCIKQHLKEANLLCMMVVLKLSWQMYNNLSFMICNL